MRSGKTGTVFDLQAACLQIMKLVGKQFSAGWQELKWGISTGSGPPCF